MLLLLLRSLDLLFPFLSRSRSRGLVALAPAISSPNKHQCKSHPDMQDTELQLLLHMLKILPQQRVKAVCLKQKSQSISKVTEVLELGFDNASQIVQPSTAFKLLCLHPEHGSFSTQDLKSPQISDLQTSHWHRRAVTQLANNLAAPDTARSLLTGFPSLSGSQNSGQKKPGSLEKPRSWPRPQ